MHICTCTWRWSNDFKTCSLRQRTISRNCTTRYLQFLSLTKRITETDYLWRAQVKFKIQTHLLVYLSLFLSSCWYDFLSRSFLSAILGNVTSSSTWCTNNIVCNIRFVRTLLKKTQELQNHIWHSQQVNSLLIWSKTTFIFNWIYISKWQPIKLFYLLAFCTLPKLNFLQDCYWKVLVGLTKAVVILSFGNTIFAANVQ